jgi:TolB-like protein/Tfp pilus assembly protein PilF
MALDAGSHFGPYEIRGALGAGGMGMVYRAHDPRLGRDVALKILPESVARDAESLARFTREARAVAALNHPNIVTIHSTEEFDGLRFITMELIEGRTLDQLITPIGVSQSQYFDVAIAIADALSAAHQKRITHRDLKPANVMVAESGMVKVLDFGLARGGDEIPGALEQATMLTRAGTVLGTAPYMSPEQIEARTIDHRSDIFSLGIVMYEMATGSRPFKGDTPAALMVSILKDHPKTISELRRDFPEGIAQLIGRCLEKDARDRVQTAQEILIEMRAHRRAWESGSSASKSRLSSSAMPASEESRFRIAVLPFQSRTGNTDAEALADGLTDDITAGLARFPYLRIVSRPDAEAAKGRAADSRAAALVGARYLLEGAVRTAGNVTRVNARLIDVETGSHLWAETFDRQLTQSNIFDVQDDLTNRIVATVADSAGVLVRSMAGSLRERATNDLSLDELVLRFFAYLQTFRADEHASLRAAFERALESQPSHALAWGCLAGLYDHEHSVGINVRPDPESRARKAAERAIELDPTCQQGWRQIALRCHFERDLNGLRVAAEQTIQLNPLSTAAAYMGLLLALAGDWDRGMTLVRAAVDLTPQHLNSLHHVIFVDHYRRGEYEDALAQAKRSNLPNYVGTPILSAAAAGQLGRATDAKAALDALRRNHPDYIDPDKARSFLAMWIWDGDIVDQLVDGFVKAKALDAAGGTQRHSSGSHRPPTVSDSGKTAPVARANPDSMLQSGFTASIAVLPFTDMSAARDQDWFCDGVAEEILNALSQLKGMRVAARASAFSFRGKGDDLKAIGEKLQVATVLDGSVRRSGDQVRITVRLSDVANGYQLWSDRYDRNLSDIFDVQEEIAKAVAARLRGTLTDDTAAQPHVVRHTENQEAYHLFLRGRHLWYSRVKGSLQRARELFEEACRKDPNYVLPWVGLSDLFAIQSLYGFEREEYANPRALEAVNRALAINDRVADAHRARGFSLLFCANYSPLEAAAAFERSISLDPSSGLSHIWYAWPSWPGRENIAISTARRAQELDPLNPYIHSLAGAIYDAYGRGGEGLREFDRAFEIDPNYLVGLYLGGGVYSRLGRDAEALRLFARGVELSGRAPFYLSYYGWALARAGRIKEARAALAELEVRAKTEYVQHLHLAIVHSALGEMDRAFELLELGVGDHNGWIGCPRMPMFENFRKDRRYGEHLRRIRHPDAEWASI